MAMDLDEPAPGNALDESSGGVSEAAAGMVFESGTLRVGGESDSGGKV